MQELILPYRHHRLSASLGLLASLVLVIYAVDLLFGYVDVFNAGLCFFAVSLTIYFVRHFLRSREIVVLGEKGITFDGPFGSKNVAYLDIIKIHQGIRKWSTSFIELESKQGRFPIFKDVRDFGPLYFFLRANLKIPEANPPVNSVDSVVDHLILSYCRRSGKTVFTLKGFNAAGVEQKLQLGSLPKESVYFEFEQTRKNPKNKIIKESPRFSPVPERSSVPYIMCHIMLYALVLLSFSESFFKVSGPLLNATPLMRGRSIYEFVKSDVDIRFIKTIRNTGESASNSPAQVLVNQAQLYIDHWQQNKDRLTTAMKILKDAEVKDPKYPQIIAGSIQVALKQIELKLDDIVVLTNNAQVLVNKFFAIDPRNLQVYELQAMLYIATNRSEHATPFADSLAQYYQETALKIRTEICLTKQRARECKGELIAFLTKFPRSNWAQKKLAQIYESSNESPSADQIYAKIVKESEDIDFPWELVTYAQFHERQNQLDQAINLYQAAYQQNQHPIISASLSKSYYTKGSQLLWSSRDESGALNSLQKAIVLDPENPEILYALGAAHGELARRDSTGANLKKALLYIKNYLNVRPENAEVQSYYQDLIKLEQSKTKP